MTAVIDCNIFVMAIPSKSAYHKIVTALMNGNYQLHISTEIYFEIAEKINEKFNKEVADAFLDAFENSNSVLVTEPSFKWNLISADEEDNKYVDCAIAANADYIVTNDKHFNVLKQISFPYVKCITIEEFMEVLKRI
jgi:putative PIN family toxin of toxin-antitoxin system